MLLFIQENPHLCLERELNVSRYLFRSYKLQWDQMKLSHSTG